MTEEGITKTIVLEIVCQWEWIEKILGIWEELRIERTFTELGHNGNFNQKESEICPTS